MNAIKILSATFLGALLFNSCKKSSDNPGAASSMPKTYTETITSSVLGNSSTTYNLTYDANNRIISLASASSAGSKFTYQYNTNNTYTMDLYNSNVLSIHEIFIINNLSFVDSTFQYNDTHDSTTEKYYYNAARQLVKVNEYDYSKASGAHLTNTHNYTYDNAGNVILDVDNNSSRAYTYYTDLKNTLSLGQTYFPQTVNLAKTTTYTSGGNKVTVNQAYTFDSSNRLTSEKDVLSTGDVYIKTYTY
jgi:hypothetical protein